MPDTDLTAAPHPHRWRRIVTLGLVVPVAAAAVLIWSVNDRSDKVDTIPVAIVNNDKILTDPQPMAAGRSLTASLTHPKSPKDNLSWSLTDSSDARSGLRSGRYYAVLTIPSDFSSSIVSSGTDKPQQGKLQLQSNGAASSTVPYLSREIAGAAGTSLGDQTTQGYLKNVYGGFNTLADNSSKAASSAAQLASGTAELSSGAVTLDQGTQSLAASLAQLSSGAVGLAGDSRSLAGGAAQVSVGATGLAQGSRALHASAVQLSGASQQLAGSSSRVAGAAGQVARGTRGVAVGVRGLAAGDRVLATRLAALRGSCRAAGGSVVFCARLARVHDQSSRLSTAAHRVRAGAEQVAGGARREAAGAAGLARGTAQLAAGNRRLSQASGRVSTSADQLSTGSSSVATGAAGLASGADQLAGGAASASAAGASLAAGSSTLASSAGQTDNGAQSLSSGLATSAKDSPTYSTKQQDALAPVVSEPVQLSASVQHSSHGNGWLLALIVAVVLWLAALVAASSLDVAAVRRNALAPVSSRRLALSQSLPVVGFAALQGVAVLLALFLLHPSTAAPLPLVLLTLLASVAFSLLALTLRVASVRAGTALFVLLLVLQVAASGNVIPLETAPGVLQTLNGVLPLTAYVNGASQLVSGGHAVSLVQVAAVLTVWAAGSGLALVSAVKRRRRSPYPSAGPLLAEA